MPRTRRRRLTRFGPVRTYTLWGLAAPKRSGITYGGSSFETKREAQKEARADSREFGVRVRVVKLGTKRYAKPIKTKRRTSKRSSQSRLGKKARRTAGGRSRAGRFTSRRSRRRTSRR